MSPGTAKAIGLLVNALGQTEFPGLGTIGRNAARRPVVTGDNIDPSQIILLKPSDIWRIGDSGVDIALSDSAMVEQNDAPQGASDTPVAASATMMSMFGTDSTAIRAIRRVGWKLRAPASSLSPTPPTSAAWPADPAAARIGPGDRKAPGPFFRSEAMPIRVITIKEHHYSRTRKVGDVYDLPGESAWQLAKAMGWAKKDEAEAAPPAPPAAPARTFAAAAKSLTAKKAPATGRGGYLRRDMTAEQNEAPNLLRAPAPPPAPAAPVVAPPAAPLSPAEAREALDKPDGE
jgi:hypothetical protein